MFRHGVHGVVADVGDGDAVFLAIRDVHHVIAGRRHCDHFELRQLAQCLRPHRHLVDDGDGRTSEARDDLVDGGFFVLDVFALERGFANLRLEGGSVQEHHPRRHAATPALATASLLAARTGEWLRQ